MDSEQRVVIVPAGAWYTDAFRRLRLYLLGWLVAAGLLAASAHSVTLGVVAVLPLVVLVLPRSIVRALPWRAPLIDADPPRVELDRAGLTLHWPRGTVHRWDWQEVDTLEVDRWCRGTLLGRDGRRLAQIPAPFVRPRTGWFLLPSLALRVVELRPEVFVASPPSNRISQPYGFRRPTPGYVPPDARAIRRRQALLQGVALFLLLAAAAVVILPLPQGLAL